MEIFLVIVVLLQFTAAMNNEARTIFINSSQMLEEQLKVLSNCSIHFKNPVILELMSSHEFRLMNSKGLFTYITDATVTIKSSNKSNPATIICTYNEKFRPTRGIAFLNSTVTIISIHLISCGTNLGVLPN